MTSPSNTCQILLHLLHLANPLSVIESKALWPLTMLRSVILSHCNLQTISPLLFVKNTLLTKLELGFNQLDSIPCESLAALPRLSGIDLIRNKIKSLNFKGCSRWSHLTEVILSSRMRCKKSIRVTLCPCKILLLVLFHCLEIRYRNYQQKPSLIWLL